MKIQNLAMIFIIIILPISIVLATYTQYQIQTINTQTLYDNKLASATYDAIRAIQLNTAENDFSELSNSKLRDLEASIATFKNSIMSTFSLNGYSDDELNNYIPALVYTLYDGFYIYSPYTNVNYRYDDNGNAKDDNGKNLYGLKPYISYSCRYIKGNIDVVITYALDNHISVQGTINNNYVNEEGYLIDGISGSANANSNIDNVDDPIYYNGIQIKIEQLKEFIGENEYPYVKLYGTKYYLVNDQIIYISNGRVVVQCKKGDSNFTNYKKMIEQNDSAKQYYYEAYKFTKWFKESGLSELRYEDAYDSVVGSDGTINANSQIWKGNSKRVFQFNNTNNHSNNIENESSSFNQHRLDVIRHKIELNLALAIANYNNYSGSSNVFQMPELKEEEWDYISHNISLISFLQGLSIGGKIYNGYSLVTNSESEEVVLESNIYMLGTNTASGRKEYYRIGDAEIENNSVTLVSKEAGRLNLDFTRKYINNNGTINYYYPLKDYDASYNSIIMQNNMTTFDDIYKYVDNQSYQLKEAFYTALGRERWGTYKNSADSINKKGILYVAAGLSDNYSKQFVNELKQNNNYDVDYKFYSSVVTSTDIPAKIGELINKEKENYDLIIVDSCYWDYLPDNVKQISQYTNLITISNDSYSSSKIPIIESSKINVNTQTDGKLDNVKLTKLGQQKIGLEINKSACIDSNCTMVKFRKDMDIEVLYNIIYDNTTYDGIGCLKTSNGKRWIYSQIALTFNEFDVMKKLIRYGLEGY